MRIGLDFDNTLVDYDALFHRVAAEQGLIPLAVAPNKLAVRDFLRADGREDRWTELQGYVYGACMDRAPSYAGAIDFVRRAGAEGHELFVISHKTRYPFLGPQFDLHAAARGWVTRHLCAPDQPLLDQGRVFFELTKEAKLARILECRCDIFIDDLPEILLATAFPQRTHPILFDPAGRQSAGHALQAFQHWDSLELNHCTLNCDR